MWSSLLRSRSCAARTLSEVVELPRSRSCAAEKSGRACQVGPVRSGGVRARSRQQLSRLKWPGHRRPRPCAADEWPSLRKGVTREVAVEAARYGLRWCGGMRGGQGGGAPVVGGKRRWLTEGVSFVYRYSTTERIK